MFLKYFVKICIYELYDVIVELLYRLPGVRPPKVVQSEVDLPLKRGGRDVAAQHPGQSERSPKGHLKVT